jgi:hypothetical protein
MLFQRRLSDERACSQLFNDLKKIDFGVKTDAGFVENTIGHGLLPPTAATAATLETATFVAFLPIVVERCSGVK